MKPEELIFQYQITGSESDKKLVEDYLSSVFETFFTSKSNIPTEKQNSLRPAHMEYCLSSIPAFVDQYHTKDTKVKSADEFFSKVTKSFTKKIKSKVSKTKKSELESVTQKPIKPKEKPHYVNNREFSEAVVAYCTSVQEAKDEGRSTPIVTDYIASCFLKIAEGLSHKANFVRYTYREEMVMDAVENCLKAIENYDIEAATRSGKPNAFAYFTQISWYAFLRRIQKEKKQQDVKMKFIAEADVAEFLDDEGEGYGHMQHASPFIDTLRMRIDAVKNADDEFKEYAKEEKKRKRRAVIVDSDLSEWME